MTFLEFVLEFILIVVVVFAVMWRPEDKFDKTIREREKHLLERIAYLEKQVGELQSGLENPYTLTSDVLDKWRELLRA